MKCMCVKEKQDSGTVRMQGEEGAKVGDFKLQSTTVHINI